MLGHFSRAAGPVSLFVALALAACDTKPTPQTEKAAEARPAPKEIPVSSETAVAAVDSVMISRPQDEPDALVIAANGVVNSAGWTDAKLLPAEDGGTSEVKSYRFVATSPANKDAMRTEQPVEAMIRVEGLPQNVRKIRILAAQNEVSADLGNVP